MSEVILKIENLSKQYRLGLVGTGTLSNDVNRWWHKVRGKEDPYLKIGDINDREEIGDSDYVWALRDINLEVNRGDVFGIIGKNGAGKSTLLKILSKVTGPTTGSIKMKGNIGALLEVGTGFHPELTGRENIYLNGAILGMTKAEITSKLDEIIDFSGVEKYIDTPTKRYSSGMTVRLGFAVAAHLEPDILVVDEVLAVGDAEFQKKAIGKMKDVSQTSGRTVLFVSHNMASVKSLCTKGVVLKAGKVDFLGGVDEAIKDYLQEGKVGDTSALKEFTASSLTSNKHVTLLSIGVRAGNKRFGQAICKDDEVHFYVKFDKKNNKGRLDTTLQIKDESGNYLFGIGSGSSSMRANDDIIGEMEYHVSIPANFFNAQTFYMNLLIVHERKNVVLKYDDILTFNILPKKSHLGQFMGKSIVPLSPIFTWTK